MPGQYANQEMEKKAHISLVGQPGRDMFGIKDSATVGSSSVEFTRLRSDFDNFVVYV